jgi:glycosyltransferase involved in cell wall biosynthesis
VPARIRTEQTVKVGDLIKETTWLPGPQYDSASPVLSVLMPTFRRGSDGTFLRAANSVLEQSERNLELIIVDDASTDGTADQIDALMRADGRVSCLRHRFNIGLPAVSEYEAFLRARAPHLAFAFDDFIFNADALGRLLEASERRGGAVVHGYIECNDALGRLRYLGKDNIAYERLAFHNFLGNSSFIVPRTVIEDVGFYDPHIAVVRLCDWDLWRRIVREYPMFREDIDVGRELGPSRGDNLGATYPQYFEAVQEYCSRSRNNELRPQNLKDFDVWELPPDSSSSLADHILMSRRFHKNRVWAKGLGIMSAAEKEILFSPKARIVGIVAAAHATAALCFDGMLDRFQQNFIFIAPGTDDFQIQLLIARSDAIILVRDLLSDGAQRIALICKLMKVPLYYLIDDNFILLRSEMTQFASYTNQNVSAALKDFAGVLCTSRPLAEYFRDFRLHPSVEQINPVFDSTKVKKLKRLTTPATSPNLRIGFVGGDFREKNLNEHFIPALCTVSSDVPATLFSRSKPQNVDNLPFDVAIVPFTASFDEFLTNWRALGLDVLVHSRGHTNNIDYKASSILLIALYLGAVPVVCSERAFQEIGEEQGVLKVDGDRSSWEDAIRRVQNAKLRQQLLSRLSDFCRTHFAPDTNARALEKIFAACAPTDILTWADRIRQVPRGQIEILIRLRREAELRTADVARLEHEAQERAADVVRLERAAQERTAEISRLEGEAREREALIAALEQNTDVREARIAELERHAATREARMIWLEREVGSRAHAFGLKARKVAHIGRRLMSWLRKPL